MRNRIITNARSKNSYKFHKFPNGKIGLTKWYPELKTKKLKSEITSETSKKRRGRPPKKQSQKMTNEQNQSEETNKDEIK